MPKFPFNYCLFLAMLLCSMSAFGLDLKQSLAVSLIIFIVGFATFVIIFIVQQATSSQVMSILYLILSTSLFILVKMVLKTHFAEIYEVITFNFDFILIPILLCGVLTSYIIDDKNDVPLFKQIATCFGVLILNVISFAVLGLLREVLSAGSVWGNKVFDYSNNFFASPAFTFIYIALVFGVINTLLVSSKKIKRRYRLYVDKMRDDLEDGRYFK